MPDQTTDLKLIALDAEDLAVVSAQLQDAVVRVENLVFEPRNHRFVALVNRFNWMTAVDAERSGRHEPAFERRQTALRFERVERAQVSDIDLKDKRRVLALLAIQFEPSGPDAPDGFITLVFAGGGAIRLNVECIECELRDLGAAWRTSSRPAHPDGEPDQ